MPKKDTNEPRFSLFLNNHKNSSFDNMTDACKEAAIIYARSLGLKESKYYLTWDIILKDEDGLTRVYKARHTDFTIIVESYG